MEHLRQVRGDQQDPGAGLAELAYEFVDGDARAHVDADRRLIEHEQLDVAGQPLAEQDLLLVAAGEMIDSALDAARLQVELGGDLVDPRPFQAPAQEQGPREAVQIERRQGHVLAHAALHDQAFRAPVGRVVEQAAVEHGARLEAGGLGPVEGHPAGRDGLDPKAGARDLRLAGADQAREADDLAGAHLDGDVRDGPGRQRQILDLEQGLARIEADLGKDLLDHAPGHELQQLRVGDALGVHRIDVAAVAQHGDAVSDAADLAHAVGDVDDADAFFLGLPDEREQPVGLALGQRRGRFVEDQDRALTSERLGDLDHLLLGARQVGHFLRGLQGEAEATQDLFRRGVQLALAEQAAVAHFRAQEQVLLDGQLRHQRELLEHRADAERAGMMHRTQIDRLAAKLDGPGFRPQHASDDRDERRFAGAVLPEQHVHLAGAQVERHGVEGENPGEPFRYALQFEEGGFEEGRIPGVRRSVPPRSRVNHDYRPSGILSRR